MLEPRIEQVTTGLGVERGDLGVLCICGEPYEADHVPEPGFVAMQATCGNGCSGIVVVGTGTEIGIKASQEAEDV